MFGVGSCFAYVFIASRTLRAALCPGMPLTAPPRCALDPQKKTFSYSVSTPQVPLCFLWWRMDKSARREKCSHGTFLTSLRYRPDFYFRCRELPSRPTARQSSSGSSSHWFILARNFFSALFPHRPIVPREQAPGRVQSEQRHGVDNLVRSIPARECCCP